MNLIQLNEQIFLVLKQRLFKNPIFVFLLEFLCLLKYYNYRLTLVKAVDVLLKWHFPQENAFYEYNFLFRRFKF